MGALSHPNLVQVLDVDEDAEGPFVVLEYLRGESLSFMQRVLPARCLPWPLVCRIGCALACGLEFTHRGPRSLGPIVHRDVTPSNVMVCYAGDVKLIDFGIAKPSRQHGPTLFGVIKGKLSYLAPEQIHGMPATPRSDLFQLGVVLHELVHRSAAVRWPQ